MRPQRKKVTARFCTARTGPMAVYTTLTNEAIAEHLAEHYAVGSLEFAVGIAQGVENTNYLLAVKTPHGQEEKFILTLYEKRVNPMDLPFFLDLLRHVAASGVACPRPIPRADGALFGPLAGKQASLVSFLHGKSRSIIRNPHAASVGQVLGRLHRAAADFAGTRANALSLAGWQNIYKKIASRLDEIQPGLEALVADEMHYAAQHFNRAEVEDAEISGSFEGDLVVRGKLTVYASGRVRGNVTYGEIEIQRGGQISGNIRNAADAKAGVGNPQKRVA
jgi:homoserine kinase